MDGSNSVDAQTGKVLATFKVGSGVVGNPITYRAPDGNSTWRCMRASAVTAHDFLSRP